MINALNRVTFRCPLCMHRWEAEPSVVEECPEQSYPYRYFAEQCPNCENPDRVPELPGHVRARLGFAKMRGRPTTAAGKAAVRDNLRGHPTPEEALRTRYNAMQHGMYAKTARYFPARPGSAWCGGCEIDPDECRSKPACVRNTDLMMRHVIAFETRDPAMLTGLRAELHAKLQVIIDMIILNIVREGVLIKKPDWYADQHGRVHFVIDEDGAAVSSFHSHPLLRTLTEMLGKVGLSLADSGMTDRQAEEDEVLIGQLGGKQRTDEAALEFQSRQTAALENLAELIRASREEVEKDPVLLEIKQQ